MVPICCMWCTVCAQCRCGRGMAHLVQLCSRHATRCLSFAISSDNLAILDSTAAHGQPLLVPLPPSTPLTRSMNRPRGEFIFQKLRGTLRFHLTLIAQQPKGRCVWGLEPRSRSVGRCFVEKSADWFRRFVGISLLIGGGGGWLFDRSRALVHRRRGPPEAHFRFCCPAVSVTAAASCSMQQCPDQAGQPEFAPTLCTDL